MKVGDYVRNCYGRIAKIKYIEDNIAYCNNWLTRQYEDSIDYINLDDEEDLDEIIKSKPNPIDLIEVGDLVYVDISPDDCGGIIVPRIAETERELNSLKLLIENKDYILKSIITHEQIESMEYKVKE